LYDVPPGQQLWQLLLVLALNKVRALATHHRAQKRNAAKTQTLGNVQHFASRTEDDTPLQILRMVIEDLLIELPDVQQHMIQLRIEGHSIGQIAESTNRSRRTVERVMQEFRQRISNLIDDDSDPDSDAS
jgi:RNA polymerase sigma-70 factor (ECF subfamily)